MASPPNTNRFMGRFPSRSFAANKNDDRCLQVELMLQQDGSSSNACTCLVFAKPSAGVKRLFEKWKESVVNTTVGDDQAS